MANPADTTKNAEHGEHRLRCLVVTPEKTWLDQHVDSVVIPLFDGEMGILPGRSPVIGRLGFGELRTRRGDSVSRYFIDGGFAQIKDDVVTILTNRAIPDDQIDVPSATQELAAAQSAKATTELDAQEKTKNVSRGRAKLRVARHRN